ncbi:MAG: ImmA/IrrE family metallo-endopeptidase [Opitutaceae bacterium]|nr:ImmA/IrrE family metallo-endopeptidase [Opitutaceae bacterium]
MRKADDSSLTPSQYQRIRRHAQQVLDETGAREGFPVNVRAVMQAAQVTEVTDDVLGDLTFLNRMRRKAGLALKSAVAKVRGLFDAKDGFVFIDRTMNQVKQTFVRLHEAAHAYLPWQRPMYAVVQDCDQTLDPEIADLFDREANVFASEVLFKLDAFAKEADEHEFGIFTPVNLSRKYGASVYASVRRYVSKNQRTCAVLVLNPPLLVEGAGFQATLRRVITSPSFAAQFAITWPETYTPDDPIGAFIPINGRKASRPRELELIDANGEAHDCIAEAFTQGMQVFVLIYVRRALTKTVSVVLTA